eukprot:CAMPEP_0197035424 /NCGR_PEP_ID=MMETSP1384-20130603/13235_1 /TAXON_ID=29189 /ORGANISM="Ammonia sp." /LENGTH=323 /DNA_ID=CAMNT_0042465489 /DNA_START=60 /DNA_END=1031 /DNA_ORIENTATION=+
MQNHYSAAATHSLFLPNESATHEQQTDMNKSVFADGDNPSASRTVYVFVGLHTLYQQRRTIEPHILSDAIVIEPNLSERCILNPSKHKSQHQYLHDILNDAVFVKTLQWKCKQSRLICHQTNGKAKRGKHATNAFWKHLSDQLMDLQLAPLILTERYYQSKLYKSKYGMSGKEIARALHATAGKRIELVAVKEILYQSNGSLNIFEMQAHQNSNAALGALNGASFLEQVSMNLDDEESKQADEISKKSITPFSSIAHYREDIDPQQDVAPTLNVSLSVSLKRALSVDPFTAIRQRHADQSKHIEDSVLNECNDWFLSDAYDQQ